MNFFYMYNQEPLFLWLCPLLFLLEGITILYIVRRRGQAHRLTVCALLALLAATFSLTTALDAHNVTVLYAQTAEHMGVKPYPASYIRLFQWHGCVYALLLLTFLMGIIWIRACSYLQRSRQYKPGGSHVVAKR